MHNEWITPAVMQALMRARHMRCLKSPASDTPAFYDAFETTRVASSAGPDFHFVLSGSAPPYPIVRISITPRLNVAAVPKRYGRDACISEVRARSLARESREMM